jgi:DNA polymerase III alpha subunit
MKYDQFGQAYATSNDICDLLYKDPDLDITRFLIEDPEQYNNSVKSLYAETSLLKRYHNSSDVSLEEFDKTNQMDWHMPKSYMDLDIAAWVLEKCKTEAELQRVGQELILYQERDLFNLLRFMKYLVDTLRQNKLVWGVGRGSSTASYVLYLIGVHRIDSLFYDLDIAEFLK